MLLSYYATRLAVSKPKVPVLCKWGSLYNYFAPNTGNSKTSDNSTLSTSSLDIGNTFKKNVYKDFGIEHKCKTMCALGSEWSATQWICSQKEETDVEAGD